MNYEELIESKDASTMHLGTLPIGSVYKQLIDRKYTNVVKVKAELTNNCFFNGDLEKECNDNPKIRNKHQLHFVPVSKGDEIVGLKIEMGSFQTFETLLKEYPAVVAQKNFINDTVYDLLDITEELHKQQIYHVCYAPSTVFARKGNNSIMLISHGSYYENITDDRTVMFNDYKDYIDPKVLDGGAFDERTDIYSIGKFIEYLFTASSMPFQYKKVIEKATQEDPDKRYQSAAEMKKDLERKNKFYTTLFTFLSAAAIALLIFGVWWDMHPTKTNVEFVKPAPRQATDDLLDDGFDPRTEMGVISGDSSIQMTPAQRKQQAIYQKKNEEIFKKQYEAQAAKIIGKIYNKNYMGSNEKKFVAGSQATMDELSKLQTDLGGKAHLTDSKSQKMAAEIIDNLTQQKMSKMK